MLENLLQAASGGPRRFQDRPRTVAEREVRRGAQRGPEDPQRTPRRLQNKFQKVPKVSPRGPPERSRRPLECSWRATGRWTKMLKHNWCFQCFLASSASGGGPGITEDSFLQRPRYLREQRTRQAFVYFAWAAPLGFRLGPLGSLLALLWAPLGPTWVTSGAHLGPSRAPSKASTDRRRAHGARRGSGNEAPPEAPQKPPEGPPQDFPEAPRGPQPRILENKHWIRFYFPALRLGGPGTSGAPSERHRKGPKRGPPGTGRSPPAHPGK